MNSHKLHRIVEYIKLQPEFPFDAVEVEDSLQAVLAWFGIYPKLSDEERRQLRTDLMILAVEAELAEVAYIVGQGAEGSSACLS